jgi:hypothetical protein
MQKRLHINNVAGEKKDAGFMGVEFMQTPIYLDKYCPMNQIYFLDSSTLHFKYLKDENFKQEVRQLPDYFAKQYITTFIGNFIIERPRHNGVITLNTYDGTSGKVVNNDNGLPEDCNICNVDKFVDYDYPSIATVNGVKDGTIEKENYSGSGVFRNDSVWSPVTDVDTNGGAYKSYQPATPVQAPLNATKKSDKK